MKLKRFALFLIMALSGITNSQELRAWHNLNFGDDPDTVQSKMVSLQESGQIEPYRPGAFEPYSATSRFPMDSNYPMRIGGVPAWLGFDFHDNKLYRLNFRGSDSYIATELIYLSDQYDTIQAVLRGALGQPDYSLDLLFWNTDSGRFTYGDVWTSGGKSHILGVTNASFKYWWRLDIQWDWMVGFIDEAANRAHQDLVRDAMQGF